MQDLNWRKIFFIFLILISASSANAQVYWCPPSIECTDVASCRKQTWDNFWRLDDQHYPVWEQSHFENKGAIYDARDGYHNARCTYGNGASQGLGLMPISTQIYPVFHKGFDWKWDNENTKQWAYCTGQDICPFTN
jgi:hypothetical protein